MAKIPHIAIIGAGPAGLTLARLLAISKAKIDITIYERDASAVARDDQGGTLDLHKETGLKAIRRCGLWDEFSKYARYDGQEMKLVDKNATVMVHIGQGKTEGDRPEIDRKNLKQILLNSVPPQSVRWGRTLSEVSKDGYLRFDGVEKAEGPFDLVVGADGGRSRVRPRLCKDEPYYAGISGLELEIVNPQEKCPELNAFVGQGGFMSSSDQKLLNAQRLGTGNLKVRSWLRRSEEEAKSLLEDKDRDAIVRQIKSLYKGWAPEITELLEHADPATLRPWILYELPVGTQWDHVQGFTLIGDAASLATPFSGEGVNKAMTDAVELASLIEQSQATDSELTLDDAVLQYEQAMFPRAHRLQAVTARNKEALLRADAPAGLIPAMVETMTLDNHSVLARVARSRPVMAAIFGFFWLRIQIGALVRKYWRRT